MHKIISWKIRYYSFLCARHFFRVGVISVDHTVPPLLSDNPCSLQEVLTFLWRGPPNISPTLQPLKVAFLGGNLVGMKLCQAMELLFLVSGSEIFSKFQA